ncbi:PREDICTED: caveolin-3-like [Branchiostoma belcheri]|uniref:Caveolin n=1 Tax=Branchiostoma belcheri TaxID=7741 RepID=A0A6P4YNN8_BRABE|nr:PREDICTED: caveolin-3-like [Branchiostoma belcheri]
MMSEMRGTEPSEFRFESSPADHHKTPSPSSSHGNERVGMHAHMDYPEPPSPRDPKGINDHVKVTFDEIIAEPESAYSYDQVWDVSKRTYKGTKSWCYRILSFCCAVPLAFFWGLYFGCLACVQIWCVVPCVKGYVINLHCYGKIWALFLSTFVDPCFESIGRMFGGIKFTARKETIA